MDLDLLHLARVGEYDLDLAIFIDRTFRTHSDIARRQRLTVCDRFTVHGPSRGEVRVLSLSERDHRAVGHRVVVDRRITLTGGELRDVVVGILIHHYACSVGAAHQFDR